MKIYDLVKELLEANPQLRDSDKKLIWSVWYKEGYVTDSGLSQESFINKRCTTPESITRAGRKIREQFPHLKGTEQVELGRRKKEAEKGTFIYREETKTPPGYWDFSNGSAEWITYEKKH